MAVLLLIATTGVVRAVGALPPDPTYWDCNLDGFADDSCVKGYKAGTGWGGDANWRFNDAFNMWNLNTHFDPQATTTGQKVYKDNRIAPCLGGSGYLIDYPAILGVVCMTKQWRLESYYRIGATPTYLNPGGVVWDWWYASGTPPGDEYPDFQGTLTHELGHWILLVDLDCAPGRTMCHDAQSALDTYEQRSLASADVTDANSVYP